MKKNLLLAIVLLIAFQGFSQRSLWKEISTNKALSLTKGNSFFSTTFKPEAFKLFTLDEDQLKSVLQTAPLQSKLSVEKSNVIISIPLSNGSIEKFRVAEESVMQPKLQAKYPQIRSYIGRDINNASTSIYFDFTTKGFHAMIISPVQKTIYINPVAGAKSLYSVFDRSNITKPEVFDCKLDKVLNSEVQGAKQPLASSDANLRTYRFAVTTGGEFSQLCLIGNETTDAEKKASVLSVLVTDLVRTNGIFETDFGVHMNYVDDEDTIIFLDGSTDPFQSSQIGYISGKWNTQSEQTIDKYIGSANYDVGHLLMGFPTGGNAGCIGCVCNDANKGGGATGFTDDLTTDPFVVDFWDHEIGHQFGANHTFDYSYEGTIAQMEPGSGSTIMGYAGTTGQYDIQPHSDPYFHAVSVQQVDAYITTGKGASCAVVTSTDDHVPTANAQSDYTIPKSTPFVLTGSASDADSHDILTYCWEQFDVFKKATSSKFPADTSTTGPAFRSLTPTTSNQRYFPALPSVLNGTNQNEWEVLPSVSRTLNFRLTVRDNRTGGGSTSNDDMVVTVSKTSGPFTVSTGNTPVTIKGGSKPTIKWNVANTNKAPVNCANVKILLSTDGGQTFPIVLLASTPNSGSARVTIPNVATTKARIEVMAIGNIFFDISDTNITIKQTNAIAEAENNDASLKLFNAGAFSVQPNPAKDYTTVLFNAAYTNCSLVLTNAEGRNVYQKSLSSVNKGTTEKISLSGFAKGVYFLKIITEEGTQTQKIVVD